MSATTTRPACPRPGSTRSPGMSPWKVTVRAARTASPGTRPVSASTPVGTSSATTGPGWARSQATAPATASRGGAGRAGAEQRVDRHGARRVGLAGRSNGSTRMPMVEAIVVIVAASGVRGGSPPGASTRTLQPGLQEVAGHHQAVAAVVARARPGPRPTAPRASPPGSPARPPARRAPSARSRGWRGPTTRAPSASRIAAASKSGVQPAEGRRGAGLGEGHAASSQIRPRASAPGASAIAKAIAVSRPWVSDTWTAVHAELAGPLGVLAVQRDGRARRGRGPPPPRASGSCRCRAPCPPPPWRRSGRRSAGAGTACGSSTPARRR